MKIGLLSLCKGHLEEKYKCKYQWEGEISSVAAAAAAAAAVAHVHLNARPACGGSPPFCPSIAVIPAVLIKVIGRQSGEGKSRRTALLIG